MTDRVQPSGIIGTVIDRAVRLAQATSSTTSAALLVAFNLVPLAGVLLWGWNVSTLLVLYWLENGVIGVLNVAKILLAEGPAGTIQVQGRPVSPASRVATAAFFLVHYGMFWVVHGIFVWTLPMFAGVIRDPVGDAFGGPGIDVGTSFAPGDDPFVPGAGGSVGPNLSAVGFGLIWLAISHGVSFVINFLGRHEYRKVSPQEQAMAPYTRLVILHLAIIFGGVVSLSIGSPIGAVIVLVLLKTAVDLRLHLREHASLAAKPTTL